MPLSQDEALVLTAAVGAAASLLRPGHLWPPPPLAVSVLLSGLGYVVTSRFTLAMRPAFIKARLFGIDLNKPETKRDASGALVRPVQGPQVPEAMGLIAGSVYLICMFVFIPFPFAHDLSVGGGGSWGAAAAAAAAAPYGFPHAHLTKFLCALLAICCMCFLGFADNVLDLRWRDKLWLPLSASLPIVMVYAVDGGGTVVVLPKLLFPLLGDLGLPSSVELGIAYYGFMACLAIFCTNAINILAGVNGLEAGQSVVIALTMLVNNGIQLWRWPDGPLHDNNLFSLCARARARPPPPARRRESDSSLARSLAGTCSSRSSPSRARCCGTTGSRRRSSSATPTAISPG